MNRFVFIIFLTLIVVCCVALGQTKTSNNKVNWLQFLKVKASVDQQLSSDENDKQQENNVRNELNGKANQMEKGGRSSDRFSIVQLKKPNRYWEDVHSDSEMLKEKQMELDTTLKSPKKNEIRMAAAVSTTTKEKQVAKEKPQMADDSTLSNHNVYVVLDEKGRIGPNFEVTEVEIEVEQTDLSDDNKLVAHKNTALLEKEVMVIDINQFDEKEIRVLLTNITNLEQLAVDRHRDLGSSFILPILASCNYDNNSAPLIFSDIPVNVNVQLNILYLANFDSALMEFTTDMEMELTWYDLRLANNYTQAIRIREKEIMDKIWRPDPYFVNSKFSYFHHVSFPNFRMRVLPSGLVTYTMRVTSVCNCFMTFCLYPHDRQVCDLIISSIAYPSSFVRFHWHSKPVHFQSRIALPELHLERLYTERCYVEGKLLPSSSLRLIFVLERDGGRAVVEKYIPSTLAMMFAWVAPYVPYNYEEVRIVTPITVLLTLVQMEKGDQEIRTSYLTSIDIWFAAMKMFTVFSLIESLTVLALIKRSRAMEKNATRASNEFERLQCKSEAYRLTKLYHRLDSICRFISPLVFVIFFVYYVLFIAQGDESGCLRKQQFSLSNPFFV